MYALGIDLGTTFTAAAVWRDGRAEIASLGSRSAAIPSVVVLREDQTIITGESASRRALSSPQRVAREFKRRLGDTTPILLAGVPYSAEALMARVLRAVVDEVSAREGGAPSAVCVSYPANWGPFKTDLLQQAVRTADLEHVTYITEPIAAAVSYAAQERLPDGAIVAVYDLGGGTFDAAVLRRQGTGFEILGRPEGIERLGGIDFDAAVFGHVSRSLNGVLEGLDEDDPAAVTAVARLREECTTAKEALSSDTDTTIPVLLPNVSTQVRLTRGELEMMVRPALQDSVDALRRALRSAGITPEDLHSVLLVGGSSRMPIVAQLVGAELGRPVAVDVHPKHAVALGAAWAASGTSGSRAVPDQPAPRPAVPPAPVPPAPAPAPAPAPSVAATMLLAPYQDGASDPAEPEHLPPLPSSPQPPSGRFPFPGVDGGPGSSSRSGRLLKIAGVAALVVVLAAGAAVAVALKQNGTGTTASPSPHSSPSTGAPLAASAADAAGAPGPLTVVAHRGGYEKYPRESLPAVADAAAAGDIVEFDILFTSDNVPVLIRETTTVDPGKTSKATPMVCTDGPYEIAKTKWSVLQANCLSLASTSKDGKRYPIATLDQAVKAVAAVKGVWMYPEISATTASPAQTAIVLATIEKYGMIRRTVVGSFFPEELEQIRSQATARHETLPIMLFAPLTGGALPSLSAVRSEHLYGITIKLSTVSKSYITALKEQHLVVMVWNLNKKSEWVAAKQIGAEQVFTDAPAAYRAWAAQNS
jgi:glycerophosphoryl diester phosphodiesterase/actin-like ATPase involved in cell morphogenesis